MKNITETFEKVEFQQLENTEYVVHPQATDKGFLMIDEGGVVAQGMKEIFKKFGLSTKKDPRTKITKVA